MKNEEASIVEETQIQEKGEDVLDLFLSSGTTTYVAKKYKRDWIGIEQDKEYIKIAKQRMK
jgi:DNA modification methylase